MRPQTKPVVRHLGRRGDAGIAWRWRAVFAILAPVVAIACDTAYSVAGGSAGDGDGGAAVDGAVNAEAASLTDSSALDAASNQTDGHTGDGAAPGNGFCASTGAGALFCADFDESMSVATGWATNQLSGTGQAPSLDTSLAVSTPASVQFIGSTSPAAASLLVSAALHVGTTTTVSMSIYLSALPTAESWQVAKIALDTGSYVISVASAGVTFDNTSFASVTAGAWHTLQVTFTATELAWNIDGAHGSNSTQPPGQFATLTLSVGSVGKNPGSVNIDNVQVR